MASTTKIYVLHINIIVKNLDKLPHISLCSSNKNKIIKSKKFVIQYTGNHIFLQLLPLYTVQILITQMFVFEGEKPLHNRQKVTAHMVLNWFANSRKEVKRLAKKGRIH